MNHALSIQELLADTATPWQIHNCKLSCTAGFDTPMPFLTHYEGLDGTTQKQYPLSFEQIKKDGQCLMTASEFATAIGIDVSEVKQAWQIKYIGSVVIACMSIKLALRLHFSNTSKAAQTVYVANKKEALEQEAKKWRVFGVVDVLHKGDDRLISVAYDETVIDKQPYYQSLPSEHSLVILNLINDHKPAFEFIGTAIAEQLFNKNCNL